MAINKIGIVKRPIADILADFSQPIPPEKIKTRTIKGNNISYISWVNLIDTLLEYTPGYCWEVRTQYLPDRVIVEGRLTIRAAEGDYWVEATGVEDSDVTAYGDAVYNAEASALRRAMAKFGYALDLWRKEKLASNTSYKRVNQSSSTLIEPIKTTDDLVQKMVTEKQIKLLYAVAKNESGLADEDVKLIIKAWGYESTKNIAIKDFDSILEAVKNAAKYLTVAQRKELQQWWREENIQDVVAKRAISGMGYDSTAQILRNEINGVKSVILEETLVGKKLSNQLVN